MNALVPLSCRFLGCCRAVRWALHRPIGLSALKPTRNRVPAGHTHPTHGRYPKQQIAIAICKACWELHVAHGAALPIDEARQVVVRFIELLLRLSAAVEDGAVAARAQHVEVQRALTPLALRPQVVVVRL